MVGFSIDVHLALEGRDRIEGSLMMYEDLATAVVDEYSTTNKGGPTRG